MASPADQIAAQTAQHRDDSSGVTPVTPEELASPDNLGPQTRSTQLYFESGSAALPNDASAHLAGIVNTLQTQTSSKARISGFHDESGGAALNAELAKKRAQAVRAWLESQGIAADRIVLDKPTVTTGDGDAKQARRVEVTVE
ncbi:OmpA family protein [Lysobacter enzymogenes]|nr:OmpA family protein [Lysobacter enzymogenes]